MLFALKQYLYAIRLALFLYVFIILFFTKTNWNLQLHAKCFLLEQNV